jgi:hypothetical protein
MAWTTPVTWCSTQLLTAAQLNTHLRDNLSALYAGSMSVASQAAGDWLQASSATQLVRKQPFSPCLSINTTPVGNVGAGEDNLMTYALAAGLLGTDGWGVEIIAGFSLAANGNNKAIKLYFGATAIGTIPSAGYSGLGVAMRAVVIRTGATAQVAITQSGLAATNGAISDFTAPAETLANAITIKATGEATSNDDISQKLMLVRLLHTP